MEYTPETALDFAQRDQLVYWIEHFLTTTGNNTALWEGLCRAPRWWYRPHKVPLSQLTRVAGPEPHMEYVQDPAGFEKRIHSMAESLAAGWQPSPLIVEYRGLDNLSLRDGNHRYVALEQAGYKEYWIIIWFNSEADYQTYTTHFNLK